MIEAKFKANANAEAAKQSKALEERLIASKMAEAEAQMKAMELERQVWELKRKKGGQGGGTNAGRAELKRSASGDGWW